MTSNSVSVAETAIRLNTKPSVVSALVRQGILHADHEGNIRAAAIEQLRRNSALSRT